MKILKKIIPVLIFLIICSCNFFKKKEPEKILPTITIHEKYANYQKQVVKFDKYQFSVSVLTIDGSVDPYLFNLHNDTNYVKAISLDLIKANTRQLYTGKIELMVGRNSDRSISWQVTAEMTDQIKGIKVEIYPIPGRFLSIFSGRVVEIPEYNPLQLSFPSGYYPYQRIPQSGTEAMPLNTQCFVFSDSEYEKHLLFRGTDYPSRFQKFWLFREKDTVRLVCYSEANASERDFIYTTPEWYIEPIPNPETGFQKHQAWMEKLYGLQPFGERTDAPGWINDLFLNITFECRASHGRICHTFDQVSERLQQITQYVNPHKVKIHLIGWDGSWDRTCPHYRPDPSLGGDEGFRQMIRVAHELGYKIGVQMNVVGLGKMNPQFEELKFFLEHQCRDAEGRALQWEYDLDGDDQDEIIFYPVSPDYEPWRQYMINRILKVVNDFSIDVVHLDQSTTLHNDCCHDHYRGIIKLFQELREQLPPDVILSGEGICEPLVFLYPVCIQSPVGNPNLYNKYVKFFDYGYYPEKGDGRLTYDAFDLTEWNRDDFYNDLEQCLNAGIIPTLRLGDYSMRINSREAFSVYEAVNIGNNL